jgi:GNAT superfamily N-acetyltransferase
MDDPTTLPRDLGGGLVLRRATAADAEALAALNASLHRWPQPTLPNRQVAAWSRDLLRGDHPTSGPDDFLVVEETGGTRSGGSGRIVSTLCLLTQTWAYDGIPIAVGQPELVGTLPEYRRRGLIREMFATIHAWGAARGELAQGIGGIPYYYRQFGYEPAIEIGAGRLGPVSRVPSLADDEREPYLVRPATEGDLPFIRRTYDAGMARYRTVALRDEAAWHYELTAHDPISVVARTLSVIERANGTAVGLLIAQPWLWQGNSVVATACELVEGESWLAVAPSLLRYLRATGQAIIAEAGEGKRLESIICLLGSQHPLYEVTSTWLPEVRPAYAWYVRVPDLPAFLRHVAPALERRLAVSPLAGHSGEVRISFYRDGLRLAFEQGKLVVAEGWEPTVEEEGDCAFPDRTFLQLLFGYRSYAELSHAFVEVWSDHTARTLLHALFPPAPSEVWGLG